MRKIELMMERRRGGGRSRLSNRRAGEGGICHVMGLCEHVCPAIFWTGESLGATWEGSGGATAVFGFPQHFFGSSKPGLAALFPVGSGRAGSSSSCYQRLVLGVACFSVGADGPCCARRVGKVGRGILALFNWGAVRHGQNVKENKKMNRDRVDGRCKRTSSGN